MYISDSVLNLHLTSQRHAGKSCIKTSWLQYISVKHKQILLYNLWNVFALMCKQGCLCKAVFWNVSLASDKSAIHFPGERVVVGGGTKRCENDKMLPRKVPYLKDGAESESLQISVKNSQQRHGSSTWAFTASFHWQSFIKPAWFCPSQFSQSLQQVECIHVQKWMPLLVLKG